MFGIRAEYTYGLFALATLALTGQASAETGAPRFIDIAADNRGRITLQADCELDDATITMTSVRVLRPGPDGNFRTNDDLVVTSTVTYEALSNTIVIDATITTDAQYRVLISENVRGANGMRLDGEFNGVGVPTGDGVQGGAFEIFTRPPSRRIARFQTRDFRNIDVELFSSETPITVQNFLDYANNGDWDGTLFHRSVPNFVIQGGGFRANSTFDDIPSNDPILNEPGISNLRGTIAMAKVGNNPNSATNQWFFNLGNNSTNLDNQNGGFTVFGEIINSAGRSSIDNIAALDTVNAQLANLAFNEIPVVDEQAFIDRGELAVEDVVEIERISILQDIASDPVITFNMANAQVMDAGGSANVMVFDVQGDAIPANTIDVRFDSNGNSVESITLTDNIPANADIALSITSDAPIRSINDKRRNPSDIMFIHANVGIDQIKIKSGIAGSNINGVTLPDGTVLPTDIDGDGSGGDNIAIIIQDGSVGRLDIDGDVNGDMVIPDGCSNVRVKGNITDCTLLFGMTDGTEMLSVQAERTENFRIDTPQTLRQLKVVEVQTSGDSAPSDIVCATVMKIQTTGDSERDGDFEANITTTGGDGIALALQQMKIAGDIRDSTMNFERPIGKIDARGDIIDSSITSAGSFNGGIKARELRRVDLDINGAMGSIKTDQIRGGSLIADSMGPIKVKGNRDGTLDGDFSMDLMLTNPSNMEFPLPSLDVAGDLLDCDINIMGSTSSVKVGGNVENVNYFQDGDLDNWIARRMTNVDLEIEGSSKRIRVVDWNGGFLEIDDLDRYDVTGDQRESIIGNLNAGALMRDLGQMTLGNDGSLTSDFNIFRAGDIKIEGDMAGATIQVNNVTLDLTQTATAIASLTIDGDMVNAFIRTRGAVGDVTVSNMIDSGLYIGAQGLQAEGFPPLASNVLGNSNLASVSCVGDPDQIHFSNSYIIAAQLGNVTLTSPDLINSADVHGISYTSLAGSIRVLINGEVISLQQSDGTFKAGDFEVRAFHQAPEAP